MKAGATVIAWLRFRFALALTLCSGGRRRPVPVRASLPVAFSLEDGRAAQGERQRLLEQVEHLARRARRTGRRRRG